jgi:hypothetical protein
MNAEGKGMSTGQLALGNQHLVLSFWHLAI